MTILLQPLLGNNRYAILVICVLGLLVLQSCTTSPDSICVETQTDITTLHSPTSYPSPLSGDGQHIVLPSRGGIYLYNTTTWQEESYLLSEPCEGYANVDFSSDNTIIAAKLAPQNTRRTDASRIFFLWDVETGALLHDWVDREKNWKYAGGGIYLSPDAARVAVPFFLGEVKVFDSHTGKLIYVISYMHDRYGSAEDPALAWGPEGKLLAVYLHDGTIGIWEIPDRPRPRKIDDPLYVLKDENSHPAHFMAFSPDGTLLAVNIGLPGKSPVIWNLATQEIVQELNIPGLCRRGRWLPSGNHLAVGCDEGVFLWSVEEERFVWEGTAHNGRVREVGVSDDEQQLVSLSWSELIVWDVESGEVLSTTILSEKIPGYCPTSP